jgi:hypothetical protein
MLIESDEQLKSALIKEMQEAINEVATTIASELTESIQTNVYNSPPSAYYKRTKEFLNSVIKPNVIVSGNEISATIGLDSRYMNSYWNADGLFNAHMSVDGSSNWGSNSVSEGLLSWWDTGTQNKYLPSVPATNYWYDVFGDHASDNPNYKKLDDLIDKVVTKHLKKFGITY